jgi:hypothetical protein
MIPKDVTLILAISGLIITMLVLIAIAIDYYERNQ